MKYNKRTKRTALSNKQKKEVRKIAAKVVDDEIEDIKSIYIKENGQLYHNKSFYIGNLMGSIAQGVETGDGPNMYKAVRKGDQISLKNINIRFWLSNKQDRLNVMYKGVLFWYQADTVIGDADVYLTQTTKMLDRYNYKQIKVIDTFILNSTYNYTPGKEKSYLATLNKRYKNKKIQFDSNTVTPKGWDLGFAVVCYDAYATAQTDNIASMAFNVELTFQDA